MFRRLVPRLARDNIEFRRLWAAQAVSVFGDQVTFVALPLVAILALDATPTQMGYLTAAALAPNLFFSLHAGALVDRLGRRRLVMVIADFARALSLATIPIAYALDAMTLMHLYAVAFLVGTFSVLFTVSYSTLFVSIVPREHYVDATTTLQTSRAVGTVAGPAVGGAIVQLLSAAMAVVIDAATFLVSALFLRRIRAPEPPAEPAARGHLAAGARYIARSPIMRARLGATATINFFNYIFWALFLLYATRALGLSAGTAGAVIGAGAVGAVVGSLSTKRIAARIGIGPAFMLGCVLFTAPLMIVPLAGGPKPLIVTLLFIAEFLSGFGVLVLDISSMTMSAAIVPDTLRGRVSGAYLMVNYGVRPLGSIAGGLLGTAIGLRPTLWIASAGGVAGILWLLPSPVPRLRELPPQDPEPTPRDALGPLRESD